MAVRRRVFVLAVAALAACDAPSVPAEDAAYDPTASTGGLIYHWPLGRTIRIYVDPAAGGAALTDHVRAGAKAWKDVIYYREFDVAIVSSPASADVVMHTAAAPFLVTFPEGCGTPSGFGAGETFFCADEDGVRFEVLPLVTGGPGAVKMDVTIDPNDVDTPDELRALVTHELGHVFGIGGHSSNAQDVMFAGANVLIPSERDAATLRYVLRQPVELQP